MSEISSNLDAVRRRIAAACSRAGRAPACASLIAVSKGASAEAIAEAAAHGQRAFGESYAQEAIAKMNLAQALAGAPLEWHFIGPLQANKTSMIAAHFAWVHGVDREKIAQRLSAARRDDQAPLAVCVQVNVSGEASKSGCAPADAAALCTRIAALPRLRLRGLMAIPAADDSEAARAAFRKLRLLAADIRAAGAVDAAVFDTLSMGMSADFEIAIEEAATLVRVGTSIFGPRAPQ